MSAHPRHRRRLVRSALLVLLALGVAISPALAAVGALHALDHVVAGGARDGQGHDHGHAHGVDGGRHHHGHDHRHDPDPDPPAGQADGAPERDHASGAHALMHQGGTVSLDLADARPLVAAVAACAPPLPESGRPSLPGDCPSLPFRPPIA